jgi:hypothetical protein
LPAGARGVKFALNFAYRWPNISVSGVKPARRTRLRVQTVTALSENFARIDFAGQFATSATPIPIISQQLP